MATACPVRGSKRVTVAVRWFTIQSEPYPAASPVGVSTSNVAVTSFERVLMRVSREKQWFAEHRYGSKLATHSAPSSTAMSSTTSGALSVAVSAPVRGSIREIVPVVGAATHSEPSPNTATDGSGKLRPRRCTVRVTVFVALSICETVLSTSFVAQSEPAAIATPAGCLPTGIAFPTASVFGAASPAGAARIRIAIVAANVFTASPPSSIGRSCRAAATAL